MAALPEPFSHLPVTAIRDLREFHARDLEHVLQAEEDEWLATLHWDFRKSADLVRRFVDQGNLGGAVLLCGGHLAGYSYFVFEEGKGLLGGLYVLPDFRTPRNENSLMNAAMDRLALASYVPRVEGQILMLSAPLEKPERNWRRFSHFRREYLSLSLPIVRPADSRPLPAFVLLRPWSGEEQDQAAHLIPATYRGHVDSRINDQYLTVGGARKFLNNILQFPGCGEFSSSASLAALDRNTTRLCGMVLSSRISIDAGHITQVCVPPPYQGLGIGRELVRRAIDRLTHEGCRTVSLTVTTENRAARMLYERLGFRLVVRFGAYVWEP